MTRKVKYHRLHTPTLIAELIFVMKRVTIYFRVHLMKSAILTTF